MNDKKYFRFIIILFAAWLVFVYGARSFSLIREKSARSFEVEYLWVTDSVTNENIITNPKATRNQIETIELIKSTIDFEGNILDIGSRNAFTVILEEEFDVNIQSTYGDLDLGVQSLDTLYDIIHYNNVIEHQFNPLGTLLDIKYLLTPDGYLILGCPLKPRWITDSNCHFNEFDMRSYELILKRVGFVEVARLHYYHKFSVLGIRPLFGSLYKRQIISILKKPWNS